MAYKSVAKTKDSISGILQGLNLNSVKNVNQALERASRKMALKLDIPESTIRQSLTMYDKVIDYLAPSAMFSTDLVDIRPQGITRDQNQFVLKQPGEQFDREKGDFGSEIKTTIEYSQGLGLLRIVSAIPTPGIELDPCTATTGWVAAGNASGLALDQTVIYQKPGALRFNLAANGTQGTLTKTIPQIDLTNYPNVGVIFLAVYLPNATAITSIGAKVGTDLNNYYNVSSTTGFLGAWTAGNWLLIALNLANATTTGTVTVTSIKYLQVYFNYTSTSIINNVYLGDVWISLPSPTTLIAQTDSIFQDSNLNFNPTITNDNDLIILNNAALAIYEIMGAVEIAFQQGGSLASNMIATLDQELNGVRGYRGALVQPGLLDLYRADNPSQKVRTTGSWYDD